MTQMQNDVLEKAQWLIGQTKRDDLQLLKIKEDFGDGDVSLAREVEKSKFRQMKYGLLEMEARFAFLQNLKKDPASWLTMEEADAELEEISTKLKSAKSENSDLQARINQSLETAVEAYGKLQERIEHLEKKLKQLEVAKEKLEGLRAKHEQVKSLSDSPGEHGGFQQMLKSQTDSLSSSAAALETCQAAIVSSRKELNKMKIVNGNLRREIELKTEILAAKQQSAQSAQSAELERVEQAMDVLNRLDGTELEVHHSDHSSLIIEIRDRPLSPSLFLKMQLGSGQDGFPTVKSAAVNVETFPQSVLDDLVQAHGPSVQSLTFHVRKWWQAQRQQQAT